MKVETKVGLLAFVSAMMVVFFAYLMGFISPFSNARELNVMYNYAGGIEEGSPVRVMGIKVGKVKSITFDPGYRAENGEEVKLRLTITIDKKAWTSVRKDSKFFINLAGVIGEKFLEISPGTMEAGELSSGAYVRGEDPPRIDQLISQGYGLAGKLLELVEKNEGSVSNTIQQIDRLMTNFNKTLALLDKTSKNKEVSRLLDNAIKISDDVAYLTHNLRSKKAEETYDLVHKLLFRLEPLDGPVIKKFFQEEGVRARIF
ncbi:organic solvent ABC transporter substrate-binding protein [Bdellovibrio bacteriovorus]|uniref:Organic solvent ABC transporter substrate-binding protein n=1 Tax=Bdellovibrio bacteriovorus TaxID=959 RepID=A0A150WQ51_BDEBC|nr:MlaD family protein [Bdellovibrio bacteriovorus]KYG66621.1 organic solvent ABC transporter substrate-binding protein [Bdellovibrio bacteriovorus]